jgi:hypothetical protein
LDVGSRMTARHHVLTTCHTPSLKQIEVLEPDDEGTLRYVSRLEAQDRKLETYTGRLSAFDKPYRLRGSNIGEWGAVRFTANGCTPGQLRVQKALAVSQR